MFRVALDDVRSHYNVGAIFRTADAVGVEELYLGGITPRPIDRFGRVVTEMQKTALGSTESVSWIGTDTLASELEKLKAEGVTIVAVEQSQESVSLKTATIPTNVCYVFGNEVTGISPAVLSLADLVVDLPMRGKKESLNVSVTAGVVLYHHLWYVSS